MAIAIRIALKTVWEFLFQSMSRTSKPYSRSHSVLSVVKNAKNGKETMA